MDQYKNWCKCQDCEYVAKGEKFPTMDEEFGDPYCPSCMSTHVSSASKADILGEDDVGRTYHTFKEWMRPEIRAVAKERINPLKDNMFISYRYKIGDMGQARIRELKIEEVMYIHYEGYNYIIETVCEDVFDLGGKVEEITFELKSGERRW